MSDFVTLSMSSNNDEWSPPEFILLLKPQKGLSQTEIHATVNLFVKFPLEYPYCQPCIKLENGQGISSKDIEQLQNELIEICKNGVGEEVTFNLAHHAQAFLAERNQKPRFQSFYEEMLATQKNKMEISVLEEKSRQAKEDEQQLVAFQEEIKNKQPALLDELRRLTKIDANQLPFLQLNIPFVTQTHNKCEIEQNSGTCIIAKKPCAHRSVEQISFNNKDGGRVYHCGPCMGGCQRSRYVCAALDSNLKEAAAITTYIV